MTQDDATKPAPTAAPVVVTGAVHIFATKEGGIKVQAPPNLIVALGMMAMAMVMLVSKDLDARHEKAKAEAEAAKAKAEEAATEPEEGKPSGWVH